MQGEIDRNTRPVDEVRRESDLMGRQDKNVPAWSAPCKYERALRDAAAARGTMRHPRGMSIWLMLTMTLLLFVPTGTSAVVSIPRALRPPMTRRCLPRFFRAFVRSRERRLTFPAFPSFPLPTTRRSRVRGPRGGVDVPA